MKYKNNLTKMKEEDFLFAVLEDNRLLDSPVVYVTPRSAWKKKRKISYEYNENQFDILYNLLNKSKLTELTEGVYEPSDPTLDVQQLEYDLEQCGFVYDEEFNNYIIDADLF